MAVVPVGPVGPVLRWLWSKNDEQCLLILDGRALVAAADHRWADLLQHSKSYAIHALGIHGTSFEKCIVDCSSEEMQTELGLWPDLLRILLKSGGDGALAQVNGLSAVGVGGCKLQRFRAVALALLVTGCAADRLRLEQVPAAAHPLVYMARAAAMTDSGVLPASEDYPPAPSPAGPGCSEGPPPAPSPAPAGPGCSEGPPPAPSPAPAEQAPSTAQKRQAAQKRQWEQWEANAQKRRHEQTKKHMPPSSIDKRTLRLLCTPAFAAIAASAPKTPDGSPERARRQPARTVPPQPLPPQLQPPPRAAMPRTEPPPPVPPARTQALEWQPPEATQTAMPRGAAPIGCESCFLILPNCESLG